MKKSTTLPARVDNLTFLIERVAEDCSPLQEYRELTQNAIEAILRMPEKCGHIIWDVNWTLLDASGFYKLCIADSGDGMTPDEIRRYINYLSSSSAPQSIEANFGIGGKVTAGYHNPEGVQYLSWKNGEGCMAQYWFDPDTREYGLKQFEQGEGIYSHTPLIDAGMSAEVKPQIINETGTVVTLLGRSAEHNTVEAPEGAAYPTHWLSRYLNRRYFRLPHGVDIRVREFSKRDPEYWPTNQPSKMAEGGQLREVHGQKHHLDKHAAASGHVQLTDAIVHWWILNDDERVRDQLDLWQSTGHVAALYKDELYDFRDGQSGRGMLVRFGVLWGHNRVVLYVEPDSSRRKVVTNAARNSLRINNESLPWDRWAEQFQEQMPVAIVEMMEEIAAHTSKNHKDSIKERLKSILDLYKLSRYRRVKSGDVNTEGSTPGGKSRELAPTAREGSGASGSRNAGNIGELYGLLLVASGDPAKKVNPRVEPPRVYWVSAEDGSRESREIEDRAALYIRAKNIIKANADFRVFTDMISRWIKEYESAPGVEITVTETVREWFEQQLVEAVLGAQALYGSREWSEEDLDQCLSEEALTLAVMPRYHVYNSVKRTLGTKFGSLKV